MHEKTVTIYFLEKNKNKCLVIYKALCFDVAQGRMNGAPMPTPDTKFTLIIEWPAFIFLTQPITIDVVHDKLGQFMTIYYLEGYPLV